MREIYRASQRRSIRDPLQDLAVINIVLANVDLVNSRAQICMHTYIRECGTPEDLVAV